MLVEVVGVDELVDVVMGGGVVEAGDVGHLVARAPVDDVVQPVHHGHADGHGGHGYEHALGADGLSGLDRLG